MKVLILGSARHGKDTIAEMLYSEFGLTFTSPKQTEVRFFIFERLKDLYGYKSVSECYEDRQHHRNEWHELIQEYIKDDKTRIASDLLKTVDIYIGMRDESELIPCLEANLFDIVIGIINTTLPIEPISSMNIDVKKYSNILILNDSDLIELRRKVKKAYRLASVMKDPIKLKCSL